MPQPEDIDHEPAAAGECSNACRSGAALAVAVARSSSAVYPRDELNPPKRPPYQVWLRLGEPVGDAPELHQALLAYASDFHLLGTATFPHGISYYHPHVQMASLDHAIWFPPPVPRRRLAAVFAGQPQRAGFARPGPRPVLHPQRACWWPAPRRKA